MTSTKTTREIVKTTSFPKGVYVVGDPCYVLREDIGDYLCDNAENGDIVSYHDESFWYFDMHGDGSIHLEGDGGGECGMDAGGFGMMPTTMKTLTNVDGVNRANQPLVRMITMENEFDIVVTQLTEWEWYEPDAEWFANDTYTEVSIGDTHSVLLYGHY